VRPPDYDPDYSRQDVVYLLFRFGGRIGAPHFRRGVLVSLVLAIVLLMADSMTIAGIPSPSERPLLFIAVTSPAIWIFAAVAVKRLHDFGRGGGWLILLVPVAFGIGHQIFAAYGLLLACLALLSFVQGAIGPNRYGPNPMAPLGEDASPSRPAAGPTAGA
jgi:uncharacterized membrane protein YhaH (DUF805 family)